MKKAIASLLAGVMLLSLAGCGDNSKKPSSESSTEQNSSSSSSSSAEESSYVPVPLKADQLPARCKPMATGDFVQPWMVRDWRENKWQQHFMMLRDAGFDTLIIQGTSDMENGKYTFLGYNSKMREERSELVANDCIYTPDMLGNLLEAAKKQDFKIFVGLGFDNQWWGNSSNETWYTKAAEMTNQSAKEIYDGYKAKYPDTFCGWYWPWEMYTNAAMLETEWAKMININLDYLTSLDPSLPVLFCPFISQDKTATPIKAGEMFTYLMQNVRFRDGDIISPQDGLGTIPYAESYIEDYLIAIKNAVDTNPKVRFWIDVENYVAEVGNPAPVDRFIRQLDVCSKYAEKLLCFSYSHYYNPDEKPLKFNTAYLEYLKTLNGSAASQTTASE